MSNLNKIFDDYMVDCNKCEPYWLGQCDGVKEHEVRNCTAYKATREVDIPKQIHELKGAIKEMFVYTTVTLLCLILYILIDYAFIGG